MISGAFVSIALLRYGVNRFRLDAVDVTAGDWKAGPAWSVLVGIVVPLLAAILLGWWLYQAAAVYAPDTWYDPTDPYSVMTCLVQWAGALVLFLLLNRFFGRRMREDLEG